MTTKPKTAQTRKTTQAAKAQAPAATAPRTAADEAAMLAQWQARCASGKFSAGVIGTRKVKVFGRAGDRPVLFPQVRTLGDLTELAPDEQFAVEYAQRAVDAGRAQGRSAYAMVRNGGSAHPLPEHITKIDPTQGYDVALVSPITGG